MVNGIIQLPIFSTGESMSVHVTKIYCSQNSKYQRIEIVNTREFGKCLILDGFMQTAETDHGLYDAEMLSRLSKSDRDVLILGGGDGYLAIHALELLPSRKVMVVDIDEKVIEYTKEYLHNRAKILHHRISFIINDALRFLKFCDKEFDGIVCDLTDFPVGAKKEDEFSHFYEELISQIHRIIRKSGWVSLQAGSTKVSEKYIPAVDILKRVAAQYFSSIKESSKYIPSYGENWSFLFGMDKR